MHLNGFFILYSYSLNSSLLVLALIALLMVPRFTLYRSTRVYSRGSTCISVHQELPILLPVINAPFDAVKLLQSIEVP